MEKQFRIWRWVTCDQESLTPLQMMTHDKRAMRIKYLFKSCNELLIKKMDYYYYYYFEIFLYLFYFILSLALMVRLEKVNLVFVLWIHQLVNFMYVECFNTLCIIFSFYTSLSLWSTWKWSTNANLKKI